MATVDEILVKVEILKGLLVARAVGRQLDEDEYVRVRQELVREPRVRDRLPRFVHSCRTIPEFWAFIKQKFAHYDERRNYLADQFNDVLSKLEETTGSPAVDSSTEILSTVDSQHVQEAWQKAMDRRVSDPDGALTTARSLLESVCKYILDETGTAYDDTFNLPKLYRLVSEHLKLAPSQHSEVVVKQILGGCCAAVEGLGALRSRDGDAHGKSKLHAKPKPRHAALAVNLAGSMSSFLIETWEERQNAVEHTG
ncbi:MAG: abortive infection family protein [Planctomycetes bacterium]|nr:abortive infection family protein [Planctomycetota bacterium]